MSVGSKTRLRIFWPPITVVRGQTYVPEAEGQGLILLSRGQITVLISNLLFNDNFIT